MIPAPNDSEFTLLIASTARPIADRHRADMNAAMTDGGRIDWQRFLRLVERHRVAPLAFEALTAFRDSIPPESFATLRAKALRDQTQALRSMGVLTKVTTCLADAGIDAISVKGPLLAHLAFGDVAVRQSRDIDVLVAKEAVAAALAALATISCRPMVADDTENLKRLSAIVRMTKDLSLVHEPSGIIVELHWRLTNNPQLLPVDIARSRQTVMVGNTAQATLGADDLLLYLSVHGTKHYWFRLKWLADVYALLANGDSERLEGYFHYAKDRGLAVPAAQTLLLLERVYGLPLTETLGRDARRTWRIRWLTWAALKYLATVREPDEQWHVPYVMLLGCVGFRSEVGYIAREIAGFIVDRPTLVRVGGTGPGYLVAILGRPFAFIARAARTIARSL